VDGFVYIYVYVSGKKRGGVEVGALCIFPWKFRKMNPHTSFEPDDRDSVSETSATLLISKRCNHPRTFIHRESLKSEDLYLHTNWKKIKGNEIMPN
jgi:hypothetical protein